MKYLIFIFLSILSINTFATGGSFGGGGASGDWGEQCNAGEQVPTGYTVSGLGSTFSGSTPESARDAYITELKKRYDSYYWPSQLYACTPPQGNYLFCNFKNNGGSIETVRVNFATKPQVCDECPSGQERINGYCQTKKCPVGQSLVNGSCVQKTCPIGQTLNSSGNCMPRDDQCPAGQIMVNGRCTIDPNNDNDPPPESEWPPFCEWASEMCQWHKEWQQWSNDYAANEEKSNLDREELKRIGLDSKEYLSEINTKQDAIKQAIQDNSLTLDKIKDQDKQFYDELRLWLKNFDPNYPDPENPQPPSEQYPAVKFPEFCDWSVQVCNWYLDWKDWRTDYNAHNLTLQEKFAEHLERLKEIKEQDALNYEKADDYYKDSKSFFDDVRDFFDWYKNQEDEPLPEPEQPTEQPEPTYPQPDDNQRVNWQESCPLTQADQTIVIDGVSTTIKGFDMSEACSMASKMRPLILLAGALISVLIIARGHS